MRARRAGLLLALGAAGYALAAWAVPPGFYDGFQTVTPYRWVSPPPNLAQGNQAPLSGHATDPVIGSSGTAPLTAFTGDGQVVVSFVPGGFQTSGSQAVTIDIKPVATYPKLNFTPATNVYLVTASAPLTKAALIELQYSNQVPAPSYLYSVPETGGAWRNLGASQVSAIYTISTRTSSLGYFAAGYPSGQKAPSNSPTLGGSLLPIIVAGVILLVLVAGVPVMLLGRRRGEEDEPAE